MLLYYLCNSRSHSKTCREFLKLNNYKSIYPVDQFWFYSLYISKQGERRRFCGAGGVRVGLTQHF